MSKNWWFIILYWFLKLIGLAPFAVINSGPQLQIRVSRSIKGIIYNCLLISLGVYLTCYAKEIISHFDYLNKSKFVTMLVTFKSIIGGIILISLWIYMSAEQNAVVKIDRIFIDIDEKSKSSGILMKNSVKSVIVVYFGINTLIWISIMVTDQLAFGIFSDLTWITMDSPCFIGSWFIIQYGFIANLLKKRFRDLNTSFENLADNIVPLNEVIMMNDFLQLKNLYNLLNEIAQEISEFYSFPIFIITTYFCGSIIYTSYYLLQPFIYYSEEQTFFLTFSSIQYLCMQLFPIIILTINITSLTNEMELVNTMVHQLINHSANCNELLIQIKRFSMTLLTRNNRFTAYNFFPIDCSLLHTIISTTATYLIILFQFQHDIEGNNETNRKELTTQITE